MNKKLVSIVIPMYNSEKYIEECIQSILAQDYDNFELILINDGSTDKTMDICEKMQKKDARIKIINQKNKGVSEARNNGIKNSKGEYITFIDSDDFIAKDFISYYVSLIEKYNTDIVLSRMPIKYRSKDKIDLKSELEKIEILNGKDCALEMLYYKIFIASWNKLFKKELLIKNNLLFEKELSFGEGFNFSVDSFLKAKKVCITSIKKYYYRVDNMDSVMTKFSLKQINGSFDSINRLEEKYGKNDNDITSALKYANWHTYFDSLNSIIGTNNINNNLDLYKKIKGVVKKEAVYAIKAPISIKEKMKGFVCIINPFFASKIVNKFRRRKFERL